MIDWNFIQSSVRLCTASNRSSASVQLNLFDSDDDKRKKGHRRGGKGARGGEEESESSDDSDDPGGEWSAKKRGRRRGAGRQAISGFSDAEVRRFVRSYKRFGRPHERWVGGAREGVKGGRWCDGRGGGTGDRGVRGTSCMRVWTVRYEWWSPFLRRDLAVCDLPAWLPRDLVACSLAVLLFRRVTLPRDHAVSPCCVWPCRAWPCRCPVRLDAIAGDAELQEKSQADLVRLADLLKSNCLAAMAEYEQKLQADPQLNGTTPDPHHWPVAHLYDLWPPTQTCSSTVRPLTATTDPQLNGTTPDPKLRPVDQRYDPWPPSQTRSSTIRHLTPTTDPQLNGTTPEPHHWPAAQRYDPWPQCVYLCWHGFPTAVVTPSPPSWQARRRTEVPPSRCRKWRSMRRVSFRRSTTLSRWRPRCRPTAKSSPSTSDTPLCTPNAPIAGCCPFVPASPLWRGTSKCTCLQAYSKTSPIALPTIAPSL